ncbi:MAG: integrase core domain-containing protein [Chloroflexi bacterium]|nr:integrase core domain-containing protein [Chloroflexota bacterium]
MASLPARPHVRHPSWTWRKEYNQVKPHSSLGYRPPAPEAKMLVTLTL